MKTGCNTDDNFWSTFSQTSGSRGRRVRKKPQTVNELWTQCWSRNRSSNELCISSWNGISLGVMAENMIAVSAYGLELQHAERINKQAMKLIDDAAKSAVAAMDISNTILF